MDDARELPGEVVGITQAGAHALADERRGQVGGVAEEEHAPAAPAVGHLRAEHVVGDPDEAQLLARRTPRPRRDEPMDVAHRFEVAEALTIEEPELPPVPALSDPHEGGGTASVADLVHAIPLADVGVRFHIDHQPTLLEAQIDHPGPHRLSDHAVGAVAAEHVIGFDHLPVPGLDVVELHEQGGPASPVPAARRRPRRSHGS